MADYGKRPDGTKKGSGYFGELKRPDGGISTELSVGMNLGGKEREVPLLVPTLTRSEINLLLSGEKPTEAIYEKAARHAVGRMKSGKSPFFGADEKVYPLPSQSLEETDDMKGMDFENAISNMTQEQRRQYMQGVQ